MVFFVALMNQFGNKITGFAGKEDKEVDDLLNGIKNL